MTRNELINKLKENFKIQELVCKHCYDKFGEKSWQFLSTELLSTLYTLRYKLFKKPIIINNWHQGGDFSQRGLRCNMCNLVKNKKKVYLSAHILGKAIDFNISNMNTQEIYKEIEKNIEMFEYPIRLESNSTTWCHLDVYQPLNSEQSLIKFQV